MNGVNKFLLVAVLALFVFDAAAEEDKAKKLRKLQPVAPAQEAEFAMRMQEAEERLAEAARQVAELSSRRLESFGDHGRYAFEFSDRPRIGINIDGTTEKDPVDGVAIVSVTPGGAAAEAGLRADDVIVSINGESLAAQSGELANQRLYEFMHGVRSGDKLMLEYLRDGASKTVELEPRPVEKNVFVWADDSNDFAMPGMPNVHVAPDVAERFRFSFGGWSNGWGDMEVVELTAGLGRYFGTDKGLLVISAPQTDDLKLQEGDVIESIDGREPSSVAHCMRILGSYQPGETLELKIMRDKRRETLKVEMPKRRGNVGDVPFPPEAGAHAPAPRAKPGPVAPLPLQAPQPDETG